MVDHGISDEKVDCYHTYKPFFPLAQLCYLNEVW